MEFEVICWPGDGGTLELDHREFRYAGKFVMGRPGKAVLREAGEIVAAASFSPDRTDPDRGRIRYVSVRDDRRGEGLGPTLLATLRHTLREAGYDESAIAVNNPYAFEAAYRAGFAWTGDETGLAELLLLSPSGRDADRYREGLARYRERESLSTDERRFIHERLDTGPPSVIDPPSEFLEDS